MAKLTLSGHEQEALRFLAKQYDQSSQYASANQLPCFAVIGREETKAMLDRFSRLRLVEWHTNESVRVLPSVLELIHDLDNPPSPNYWKELFDWWFKSKWRVAISAFVVLLPLVVQWIEMITKVLSWVGVVKH